MYPEDSSASAAWWSSSYTTTNANSQNDGATNTTTITEATGFSSAYAAGVCNALGDGWYLPAVDEMSSIHKNELALNTEGANILSQSYWTSTEYTPSINLSGASFNNFAWFVGLGDGDQRDVAKNVSIRVRCAKQF